MKDSGNDNVIPIRENTFKEEIRERRLKDWICSYIEYVENSEPPFMFHLWAAIAAISCALERKVHLNWHDFVYPNMYVALVAPQGVGRKSTTLAPMRRIVQETNVRVAPDSITAEALVEFLMNSHRTPSSMAAEALGIADIQHCSVAILESELKSFVRGGDEQMLTYLTRWYDCPYTWTYETKHAPVRGKMQGKRKQELLGVCPTVFGCTTPEWFSRGWVTANLGEGLLRRFILVYEDKIGKIIADPTLNRPDPQLKEDLIYDLQIINSMIGEMTFDKKGKEFYVDYYTKQRQDDMDGNPAVPGERFSGYMSTRATHLLKLSMCISASRDCDMVIKEEDIVRAVDILERTEKRMSSALQGTGDNRIGQAVDLVLNYIREKGKTTRGQMLSDIYDRVDPFTLDQVEKVIQCMPNVQIKYRDRQTHYEFRSQMRVQHDETDDMSDDTA